MNFWWGRRSKEGHEGNSWNVNIFFFLATLWAASLIVFAGWSCLNFPSPPLPHSRLQSKTTETNISPCTTPQQYIVVFFFSCCLPLWILMICKQDIFLEQGLSEPPLFCFLLVVHGGGTPGTGSVWLYFSAEEEMRVLLLLSTYQCTLLIAVIFLLLIIHTNKCTPLLSFCGWRIYFHDFNHSFRQRMVFAFVVFWSISRALRK